MGQTRYPDKGEAMLLAEVRPQPLTLPAKAVETSGDPIKQARSPIAVDAWLTFPTRDGFVTVKCRCQAVAWNSRAVVVDGLLKGALPYRATVWANAVTRAG